MQKVIDNCELKHASLELIQTLFRQMYQYAEANNLCDKNYAQFVRIDQEETTNTAYHLLIPN